MKVPIADQPVLVLDDAAGSNIWSRECLAHGLIFTVLKHYFVKGLSGKGHDGTIRMNGARLQVFKVIFPGHDDLNVSIPAPLIATDLDAAVDKLIPSVVIPDISIVELHGGRAD